MDSDIEDQEFDSEEHSKSEAEIQREKNIKERDEYLKNWAIKDPEFAQALDFINSENKENVGENVPKKKTLKKPSEDSTFRFTGQVPTQRRSSSRLAKSKPQFTGEELDEIESTGKKSSVDSDDEGELLYLTRTISETKPRRSAPRSTGSRPPIIPVSEVTEQMLNNISLRVSEKVYDSNGTSCHQCRQKTSDQKTSCRNPQCIGVQGQFCGVCIRNRYGEDAADALMDPEWTCFVCRDMCNCSFCRKRQGKRPTGILTPIATKLGYSNVNSLLVSLQGEGDFIETTDNEENLPLKKRKQKFQNSNEEISVEVEEQFLGFDNITLNDEQEFGQFLGWGKDDTMHFEKKFQCQSCNAQNPNPDIKSGRYSLKCDACPTCSKA
ncbi:unnamed protein product [Brassicogethes aeneus]|uniref:Zinc-finger domain-containing protein n=1 Tax=Brassicogethes aeneus TaxID=1431903 RepID=A0A9P0BHA8_BRAAE|nr:unnamed protein product [Brassicogethes aeneus]